MNALNRCCSVALTSLTLALVATPLGACGAPHYADLDSVRVEGIRIDSTNVGLISRRGQALMVDIGLEGAYAQLLPELERRDFDPSDIGRAIITHGHGDHVGDANALLDAGIDVWVHGADQAAIETGENEESEVIGLEANILASFVTGPFPPSEPHYFNEDFIIPELGVIVEHVGGHTAGSVVVVVEKKVGFVGDLVRGGNLGGLIAPEVPQVHYFHNDQDVSHQAIRDLLERYPDMHTVWPAHGGPFTRDAVETWLEGIGF